MKDLVVVVVEREINAVRFRFGVVVGVLWGAVALLMALRWSADKRHGADDDDAAGNGGACGSRGACLSW